MKIILSFLLALSSISSLAQYPVTSISITLPPQPKPNTGDWAMPFIITAQARLVQGQVPGNLVESRILLTIKKNGAKFCSGFTSQNAPMSVFNTPTKTWSGGTAFALLGNNCFMPPGNYELCVQFFTSSLPVMPLSNEVCKSFTIPDINSGPANYTPPQNVMPVDGKVFTQKEANLPIMFRWTPVLPKSKEDVIYKVRLYEVVKGTSKAQAIKSGSPVETIEVKNITQAGFKLAPRCNNCEWVWNVEASKKSQLGEIEIVGTSEASSFRINPSPNSPQSICNDVTVNNTNIDCQAFPTYLIHDKITNNSGKNIISWTLTSTAGTFNNTGPQLISGNSSVNTQAIGLTNAIPDGNRFVFATYTFTFDDNATCTIGMDYLLPDCNPTCGCGQWSNIRFNIPSATGGATTSVTASCGGNDTVKISPNANFTIVPGYNCTGSNCQVSFKYDVFFQSGVKLYDNVNASVIVPSEMNTCGEVYKIVIKPTCNGQVCNPCTIFLKRNCPPVCQCTNHPTVVKRTVINGTVQEIPFSCTEPAPYIDKLKCNGNDTIIVKNFCTGTCPAQSASLSIKRPDGTTFTQPVWSTAPGEVWFLLPPSNQNGIYKITVITNCGNQNCTNCIIDFQQNCPPACSCGTWSSVIFRAETIPGIPTNINKHCLDTMALPKDVNFTITPIYNCPGNNCNASFLYDVFLSVGTQIYSNVTAAQINSAQLNSCGEVYRIVIKPTCGSQSCTPCTVYLKRNCPPLCTCGTWTNTKATYTVLSTLQKDNPVSCGKGIAVDCNKPVTIKWAFNCIGQCAAATTVIVYKPSGAYLLGTIWGDSITFTPTILTGGPYKVVLKGTCGNNTCDSCIIYVTPKCFNCDCGKWNGVKVNGKRYECNAKAIPWKCNTEAEFAADYQCSLNNETCKASISWDIKLDGKIIKKGTGSITGAGLFKPTTNGNYVITFYPSCNEKNCPPCSVTLAVTDCMECSCDKFTFTGSVTAIGKTKEGKCKYAFDGTAYNPCNEIKQLSLTGSSNISFNPSTVMLNPGNNAVHFEINNLTLVTTGYIRAVIMINGKPCERRFDISLPPCDDCSCGNWNPFLIQGKKYNCGDVIDFKCNTPLNFSNYYKCNGTGDKCITKTSWVISKGNTVIKTGTGANNIADAFTPMENGIYTITLNALCNNKECPPCILIVKVNDCVNCECGSWKSITAKYIYKNAEKQKDLKCGDSLDVDCNKPFKLNADYNCIGTKCDKTMLYYVTGPDGTELVSGESLPVNFTPTKDGIYKIILRANCGSGACPDCIIYLKVVCDPPPCDFCKDFTEAALTQKSYAYSADNNQLDLTQSLNIPGQYKIKQVKVELIAFDWHIDNTDCRKCQKNSMAFGVLTETMLKANGLEYEGVTPAAIFNTHEQDINCLPANGAQLGYGSNIKLGISLPWQTSLSCCGDKFSFCIRYTIVTTDCKTCSIVKCYTDVPPRQHKIINDGDGTGN